MQCGECVLEPIYRSQLIKCISVPSQGAEKYQTEKKDAENTQWIPVWPECSVSRSLCPSEMHQRVISMMKRLRRHLKF